MAEHAWSSRRAQDLVDKAVVDCNAELLSLFLRYQTANDRGFRACLYDLLRLRREQRQANREFESQNREAERHDSRVRLANARAMHLEIDTELNSAQGPDVGRQSVKESAGSLGSFNSQWSV